MCCFIYRQFCQFMYPALQCSFLPESKVVYQQKLLTKVTMLQTFDAWHGQERRLKRRRGYLIDRCVALTCWQALSCKNWLISKSCHGLWMSSTRESIVWRYSSAYVAPWSPQLLLQFQWDTFNFNTRNDRASKPFSSSKLQYGVSSI